MKYQVFLPAFNEGAVIGAVVSKLRGLGRDLDVVVVDDGSRDDTARAAELADARVVRHPMNLGGGAAVRTAFALASLNDVDYILTMNSDGQHDPGELEKFIEAAEREMPDIVIETRFWDGSTINMRMYRSLGIWFFSRLFSWMYGIRLTDITNCYRMYRVGFVRGISSSLRENKYYAIEILKRVTCVGGKIVEVPVADISGVQEVSKKGVGKYLYNLIRVILK